jgi:hypothetical protein
MNSARGIRAIFGGLADTDAVEAHLLDDQGRRRLDAQRLPVDRAEDIALQLDVDGTRGGRRVDVTLVAPRRHRRHGRPSRRIGMGAAARGPRVTLAASGIRGRTAAWPSSVSMRS